MVPQKRREQVQSPTSDRCNKQRSHSIHRDTMSNFGRYSEAATDIDGLTGYQDVAGNLVENKVRARICPSAWKLRPLSEELKDSPQFLANAKRSSVQQAAAFCGSSEQIGVSKWGYCPQILVRRVPWPVKSPVIQMRPRSTMRSVGAQTGDSC